MHWKSAPQNSAFRCTEVRRCFHDSFAVLLYLVHFFRNSTGPVDSSQLFVRQKFMLYLCRKVYMHNNKMEKLFVHLNTRFNNYIFILHTEDIAFLSSFVIWHFSLFYIYITSVRVLCLLDYALDVFEVFQRDVFATVSTTRPSHWTRHGSRHLGDFRIRTK